MEQISLCILIFIRDFGGLKMKVDNLCSVLPTPFFFLSPFLYYNLWHTHDTLNARYRLVAANILKLKGKMKAYCFSLLLGKHINTVCGVVMWLSLDLKTVI